MQPIKIFFSCAPESPKDKRYVYDLENHFADQKRSGEVTVWHVHKISPGANVKQELLTNLNSSDIILIFLSPDYMTTDHCVEVEGMQAASMQSLGIASVRVIQVRPIDWRTAPFNFCQILPESGDFLSKLPDREQALHKIAMDISTLVREVRNSRSVREANRVEHSRVLHQAYYMPLMAPIESLIKAKQTDASKLMRQTDEVTKTRRSVRQIDEVTKTRRTEDLKQRKPSTKERRTDQVLADYSAPSEFRLAPGIKPFPRSRQKSQNRKRGKQNTPEPKSTIRKWLGDADKEYRFMSKGKRGLFFFYPMILIDAFGTSAAILNSSNSWMLFGLSLFISLLSVVIGAVNTGSLIPIPLALLYAGAWAIIISHYLALKPLYLIITISAITLAHILLFRKNYR